MYGFMHLFCCITKKMPISFPNIRVISSLKCTVALTVLQLIHIATAAVFLLTTEMSTDHTVTDSLFTTFCSIPYFYT